jgi:multidrug resistance efflux pump
MERNEVIKEALREAEAALLDTESELNELRAQEQQLKAEIHGLRLALAAYERPQDQTLFERMIQGAGRVASAYLSLEEWRRMPRTDAIIQVFAERGGESLHRKELTNLLHARGRDDAIEDVSAALAYLKRQGRAESLGHGRWSVPLADLDEEIVRTLHPDEDHVEEGVG